MGGRRSVEVQAGDGAFFQLERLGVRVTPQAVREQTTEVRLMADDGNAIGLAVMTLQRREHFIESASRCERVTLHGLRPASRLREDLCRSARTDQWAGQDHVGASGNALQARSGPPGAPDSLGGEGTLGVVGPAFRVPRTGDRVPDDEELQAQCGLVSGAGDAPARPGVIRLW